MCCAFFLFLFVGVLLLGVLAFVVSLLVFDAVCGVG